MHNLEEAATTGRPQAWTAETLRILAAVMVINVTVPHVPAAFITGGYVPGLFTAPSLNLPVAVAFLVRARDGVTSAPPAAGTRSGDR